jgi:hypothetical protein
MSWNKKVLFTISFLVLSTTAFFAALEAISSILYYQRSKPYGYSLFSTVQAVRWIQAKIMQSSDGSTKLDRVISLRKDGIKAYPSYLFNPQLHDPLGFYHLANPPLSTIVYCDESGSGYRQYLSDELGFRNPRDQLGKQVDYIFIGDSFTEGSCEDESNTIAGSFRESGKKVFNLGRDGTGPLHQLATLREYGSAVSTKTVLWFIFTGNDLQNLREEKTSFLARYLEKEYSQGLLRNASTVSRDLEDFLNREITLAQERKRLGLHLSRPLGYGETLDFLEAKNKELELFIRVAGEIKTWVSSQKLDLKIVLLNHPENDHTIQDLLSVEVRRYSDENKIPYLEISRAELNDHRKDWYNINAPHFNAIGYRAVARRIIDWLSSRNPS